MALRLYKWAIPRGVGSVKSVLFLDDGYEVIMVDPFFLSVRCFFISLLHSLFLYFLGCFVVCYLDCLFVSSLVDSYSNGE